MRQPHRVTRPQQWHGCDEHLAYSSMKQHDFRVVVVQEASLVPQVWQPQRVIAHSSGIGVMKTWCDTAEQGVVCEVGLMQRTAAVTSTLVV